VRVAGEVAEVDLRPYPFLQPREMAHWTSPIFKYALLVVHRALEKSGIVIGPEIAPRVAITFSSAVGGLDAVLQADRLIIAKARCLILLPTPIPASIWLAARSPSSRALQVPICSTITACATGVTSLIIGEMLLQRNMADVVICGAVDFPLVEPIVPDLPR